MSEGSASSPRSTPVRPADLEPYHHGSEGVLALAPPPRARASTSSTTADGRLVSSWPAIGRGPCTRSPSSWSATTGVAGGHGSSASTGSLRATIETRPVSPRATAILDTCSRLPIVRCAGFYLWQRLRPGGIQRGAQLDQANSERCDMNDGPTTPVRPEAGEATTTRVLVAEDEEPLRNAISDLVASEPGLVVVGAAASAGEAIDLAQRTTPDVAVVDVRMPGGGVEAARGIRERSPATRVLGLSAYEDQATVLEMLRAGAVGYLVKGISPAEVV